jgi:hypothetical protein
MGTMETRLFKGGSEIDEIFCVVSKVIFGPNFDWEVSGSSEERLVMKITACPLLREAESTGRDFGELSRACSAYLRSAVENLNPRCTQRYATMMCTGDGCCENVIDIRS